MSDATVRAEGYHEKHGFPLVSLHDAKEQILLTIRQKQTHFAFLLVSDPGCGKSQLAEQIAREVDRPLVDIRTATFNMISAGIPQRADEKTGLFRIALPDMFITDRPAIYLFDEFTQGGPQALNMFFQMMEDGRYYNHILHPETIILAAMNPPDTVAMTTKIESNTALNRRFKKMYIHLPYAQWSAHARTTAFHRSRDGIEKPCHLMVREFLGANQRNLYDSEARRKHQQFACPATWQTISRDMHSLEAEGMPLHDRFAEQRFSMTIGNIMAGALTAFISDPSKTVTPRDLLSTYATNENLRKMIKARVEAHAASGGMLDLLQAVSVFLFEERPVVSSTARHLATFWMDLPSTLQVMIYTQLASARQDVGDGKLVAQNNEYLKELTQVMQHVPGMSKFYGDLTKLMTSFGNALRGSAD